ncbi:hypothetical protein ARMGADRAFT_1091911 [Armillaria gallica]|uniref:Uncharacterized protein n=1 Tax=Armillaria gallica TaxID=47427 RepID=A0A2H3CZN2_ARMGA|nr:hypothetical protein ARMGADRAFT_1091911 [Armillaria gallica]
MLWRRKAHPDVGYHYRFSQATSLGIKQADVVSFANTVHLNATKQAYHLPSTMAASPWEISYTKLSTTPELPTPAVSSSAATNACLYRKEFWLHFIRRASPGGDSSGGSYRDGVGMDAVYSRAMFILFGRDDMSNVTEPGTKWLVSSVLEFDVQRHSLYGYVQSL